MTRSLKKARIIAAHGRHYLAEQDGELILSVTRGKKSNVAVGDYVMVAPTAKGQAVIESIEERETLLFRSDQFKSKLLAANVTQLFIVVATEPGFADDLISRALVATEAVGIKAHLILNKIDIANALPKARERLQLYAGLGYLMHEISATAEPEATRQTLIPLVENQITILIGQSGMGKSSIINILIPGVDIATREISAALDSGKHTTTFTRLYRMNEHTALIDSPGFQEFGLYHLDKEALEQAFREFRPHLGHCRFHNCRHLAEPGCAILEAVEAGGISPMRHRLYTQLLHEASQKVY
ncbi:ribosome small subunit-dependent GTPase A [Oxalobacter vibrioformis]|uniref:Small ribosomal subunit biogenesis GTPase RsgA n=1 Tax=Oxalobacter vibrioformis TaxID=933080 RepID=A0A9E9M0W7_9BURK|nr:ribosome small subunit-dependent GTPase A [Oxalobacter vibrioformis]WAW11139.1 ribosome small subunit-dependent GTPase A [Oxalobacter vibrioformis]